MASKSTNHPLNPFKDRRTNFDAISTEINNKNTMKNIEQVIEEKRKNIFDILSTSMADWNTDKDEKSLKKMKDALDVKKASLEDKLWEITTSFNISSDNTHLVNFCKDILNKKDPTKKDKVLWDKCWELLEKLQNVYLWKRHEKLFSGKKDPADGTFKDLTSPDSFNTIFGSKNLTELQKNIDDFINKVYNSKDNSFSISKSKLYWKNQAEIATRIAIFLHCMQKSLNEWRISNRTKVKSILSKLENEQIPKIRWLYNLQKEEKAVNTEYNALTDIRKNDITDITWTDTTTDIDLTDSFEGKSNKEAKDIDFYNLNKNGIKITIWWTTYPASDIILKDASGSKNEFNTQMKFSSWDYTLCLKIWWNEVEIWKLCIDYSNPKKALFVLKEDSNIISKLNSLWVTWNIDVEIPIMAVKNVANTRTYTWQVSLTRKIKRAIKWVIVPPHLTLKEQRERQTTITNVNQVNRAIAEREADEELRERYKNVGWNVLDRANLFLRRKFIKDKIVNKKMKWKSGIDWSESGQSAAHRHQIEEKENLSDNLKVVVDIDEVNYPETRKRLDDLINDFTWRTSIPPRTWGIDENNFHTRFEAILKKSGEDFDTTSPTWDPNWKKISEIITSNKLRSLSTNIIIQAKQFQAHQKLVYDIREHILANPAETDVDFDKFCRWEISTYINTYDDIPDFLNQIEKTPWGDTLSLDNANDIKILKWQEWALASIQAKSMKYRLQILDGWDEAYNIKKRWWRITKVWRVLDDPTENSKFFREHPHLKEAIWWILWGTKLGVMVAPWLLLAPFGPLAVASWVGGMAAITTLVKKKSHYEKENRSYQRMQATNLSDYRNKRTNIANEVAWMKWYEWRFWWEKKRIRDQYNDYVLTTHDQWELTSDLIAKIKAPLKKWWPLTAGEKDSLGSLLADWLARLDFHKKTWQNFLWSDNTGVAEKEYRQLQNAIIWWTLRLGIDVSDLKDPGKPYKAYYDTTMKTIRDWSGNEYNTQWYEKAMNRFKRRSRKKAWVWALKAWAISFGLSYLASSLASWTKTTTTTNETSNTMYNWQVWWEYNLWDVQEHLFVSWDVNPTMNTVINSSTSEITKWSLYSSVDAARCSAEFWAKQLAQAQIDLASTLCNPIISGNSDLVSAINNYVADATTKIWAIPWLSAWNHDLAIARAIEAAKEWILEPIISSCNTSIKVPDVTCLSWTDWGISTSVVSQSYRNMGIMSLDYIQKWAETVVEQTARAIPIPTPGRSNTFWAPKSDPK